MWHQSTIIAFRVESSSFEIYKLQIQVKDLIASTLNSTTMFKLFCLLVVVAVAVAMPSETSEKVPVREGIQDIPKEGANSEDAPTVDGTTDAQEDMDKAETFGFGYRKIVHVYPHYYPRYYYGGYYPRYYYGHYGHYW
uniref:Uncharacterized protein n=1 Tax=Anopheles atroparvus TaxID=41427 RepID=A0AAG5D291_ANOAO